MVAGSDSTKRLLGAWQLLSYRRFHDGVFHRDTLGERPQGRIIYEPSGFMAAFLLTAGWAEKAAIPLAWNTFLAYSARWHLVDPRTVHHHVDMASVQEFIGTTFVRTIEWQADGCLRLITEPRPVPAGHRIHDELVWRRFSEI